jgi:hypothetical protein
LVAAGFSLRHGLTALETAGLSLRLLFFFKAHLQQWPMTDAGRAGNQSKNCLIN